MVFSFKDMFLLFIVYLTLINFEYSSESFFQDISKDITIFFYQQAFETLKENSTFTLDGHRYILFLTTTPLKL